MFRASLLGVLLIIACFLSSKCHLLPSCSKYFLCAFPLARILFPWFSSPFLLQCFNWDGQRYVCKAKSLVLYKMWQIKLHLIIRVSRRWTCIRMAERSEAPDSSVSLAQISSSRFLVLDRGCGFKSHFWLHHPDWLVPDINIKALKGHYRHSHSLPQRPLAPDELEISELTIQVYQKSCYHDKFNLPWKGIFRTSDPTVQLVVRKNTWDSEQVPRAGGQLMTVTKTQ